MFLHWQSLFDRHTSCTSALETPFRPEPPLGQQRYQPPPRDKRRRESLGGLQINFQQAHARLRPLKTSESCTRPSSDVTRWVGWDGETEPLPRSPESAEVGLPADVQVLEARDGLPARRGRWSRGNGAASRRLMSGKVGERSGQGRNRNHDQASRRLTPGGGLGVVEKVNGASVRVESGKSGLRGISWRG